MWHAVSNSCCTTLGNYKRKSLLAALWDLPSPSCLGQVSEASLQGSPETEDFDLKVGCGNIKAKFLQNFTSQFTYFGLAYPGHELEAKVAAPSQSKSSQPTLPSHPKNYKADPDPALPARERLYLLPLPGQEVKQSRGCHTVYQTGLMAPRTKSEFREEFYNWVISYQDLEVLNEFHGHSRKNESNKVLTRVCILKY